MPAALIALALLPVVAGSARLVEMAGGAVVLDPPHSVDAPVPLAVHIVSAIVFTVLGALQLSPGSRGRRPRWHRVTGRIAAPAGIVAALSGLWLALGITGADGALLTAFRSAAAIGMAGALVLGISALLAGDLRRHRAWMMRGYALGIGAGTQSFTAALYLLALGVPGPTGEALIMGAGWAINVAVAEWLIRRPSRRRPSRRRRSAPAVPSPTAATAA